MKEEKKLEKKERKKKKNEYQCLVNAMSEYMFS